jgi:hypothetical protein
LNKIAIILLNYNSWLDTLECLESLLKQQTDYSATIFVVDNSPENESVNEIKNWAKGKKNEKLEFIYPEITSPSAIKPISIQYLLEDDLNQSELIENIILIKAKTNSGFSAGNNVVLKYLKDQPNEYDWIWLLNNDTVVKSNGIKNIFSQITPFENELILFGTPLMEYYKPDYIQAIGGKYNKYIGRPSIVGAGLKKNLNRRIEEFKVDYPIGASMILTKKSLQRLGLLSEFYFLFFEELDWTTRIKKLGGHLKIISVFDILHKQGSSTKQNVKTDYNVFMEALLIRNRLVYARKYNKSNLIIIKFSIIFLVIPKKILNRQFGLVKELFKISLS